MPSSKISCMTTKKSMKLRWNVDEALMTAFSLLCVNGPLKAFFVLPFFSVFEEIFFAKKSLSSSSLNVAFGATPFSPKLSRSCKPPLLVHFLCVLWIVCLRSGRSKKMATKTASQPRKTRTEISRKQRCKRKRRIALGFFTECRFSDRVTQSSSDFWHGNPGKITEFRI